MTSSQSEGRADSVSAVLIVKDEEAFLEGCLASLAGHVDEVVVVDTGSTDRTMEIARDHGCALFETPWDGDFSKARNVSLDRATSRWCLYIDADERLVVGDGAALKDGLTAPDHAAFMVPFSPRVGFTRYHEVRLFRAHPAIRFQGVIHEAVHPSIGALCRETGMTVGVSKVAIDHLGYEGDLSHKFARNLPLLEVAVKQDPERVFIWAHLGETLAAMGRLDEAETALRTSIAVARNKADPKQRIDGAMAWMQLVSLRDVTPEAGLALVDEALADHPTHRGLKLARATRLFACQREAEAKVIVEALLREDADTFLDPLVAYDKRIFTEWPACLLGDILVRQGDRRGAGHWYAKAAAWNPGATEYRAKAAFFSAQEQR